MIVDPDAPPPLRFGLSRRHGGVQLLDGAEQFVEELGAALKRKVDLRIALSYQQLHNEIVGGDLDLAWLPPLLYVEAVARGVTLLAVAERAGATSYRGALLVRADGGPADVASLRGARAAWVDRHSAAGYVYPLQLLVAAGLDPERDLAFERFYGSAPIAAAAVVSGEADLCTCFVSEAAAEATSGGPVSSRAREEIRHALGPLGPRLRVLALTRSIPSDGLVAAAHVPAAERARLTDALVRLHTLDFGADALETLLGADRLVAPTDAYERLLAAVPRAAAS